MVRRSWQVNSTSSRPNLLSHPRRMSEFCRRRSLGWLCWNLISRCI